MPLRIGFDLDGVLADFASAYHEVEVRLFGAASATTRAGNPEEEEAEDGRGKTEDGSRKSEGGKAEGGKPEDRTGKTEEERTTALKKPEPRPSELRRRRDRVWEAIQETPDFWTTLKPLNPLAVRRIYDMMVQHRWEVFFITQRPATEGDTVQRQTQRWLVQQGFDLPSVLVIPGSRGAAAGALQLDYHVDDSAKNCIDVKSESRARPLLIIDPDDDTSATSARRLGIGTATNIDECLAILEQASLARTHPNLLNRIARLVGWK